MSPIQKKETIDRKTVVLIVGSMLVGVFGIAMTIFNLIADHKVSQMEARMAEKFALVREIESVKAQLVGIDTKIDMFHMEKPKGGDGTDDQ